MGNFTITVDVDGADKLEVQLVSRAAEVPARVRRLVHELGQFSEYAAKQAAPNRTSLLEQNIRFNGVVDEGAGHYSGVIGVLRSAFYARWVEQGTGLYDPLGPHYIFPKSGNFMVWTEKGFFATAYAGRFVGHEVLGTKGDAFRIFASRTKGQRGQHYMRHAFELMTHTYLPARLKHLADDL